MAGAVWQGERGVTLMVVLVALVVIGLAAGIAGRATSSLLQQDREAELLFRGDQYRRAIESYHKAKHGSAAGMYPNKLEDLLRDPRSLQVKRHLRQLYKDPFSGGDFDLIQQGGEITGLSGGATSLGAIKGVRSTSQLKPFKEDGFPRVYEAFKGATSYNLWEFVYEPPRLQPGQPGTAPPAAPPANLPQ